MWSLVKKEVRSFLSSVTGYVVLVVFLLTSGLFMWVFPGNMNLLDMSYSNLDTLFFIGPWVFMFLIPAITMRSFSEEKRVGTIELLLTRPISDLQIIFSKYIAGLLLVIIAIIPTLISYWSIYQLGDPVGNIDAGGTWGSYIGLIFLGSAFVGMGIFASSLTQNQVVAFIVAVFLCFLFYIGFEQLASFSLFGPADRLIEKFGINEHYASLSRGVIDSRDVMYFVAFSGIFILLTRTVLQSRKW